MHQEQPKTYFLFRYESTCGLWVETKLASQACRAILEAMNVILRKDGILAFIGTKSEFGQYLLELESLREEVSTSYWTSLPEHTILATLGLCLNPSTSEGRSLVFHGSPRTLMLGYLISSRSVSMDGLVLQQLQSAIERNQPFYLDHRQMNQINPSGLNIYPNELQDSIADFSTHLDGELSVQPD